MFIKYSENILKVLKLNPHPIDRSSWGERTSLDIQSQAGTEPRLDPHSPPHQHLSPLHHFPSPWIIPRQTNTRLPSRVIQGFFQWPFFPWSFLKLEKGIIYSPHFKVLFKYLIIQWPTQELEVLKDSELGYIFYNHSCDDQNPVLRQWMSKVKMLGSEGKHLCLSFKDMPRAGKKFNTFNPLDIGNKVFDLWMISQLCKGYLRQIVPFLFFSFLYIYF